MDVFLFESFTFELDDKELITGYLPIFAKQSETMIEVNDKITFNYYPQDKRQLQIVIEAKREKDGIAISNMKLHHTSENVWRLKISNPLSQFDDCYIATREDDSGLVVIRLVNEQVLGEIKPGDIIEAQVAGIAMAINIYENDDDYAEKTPISASGYKNMLADGSALPLNLLVNNSADLSEEEREQKDHSFDNLVTVKGTIKACFKHPINIYGMDAKDYYSVLIGTEYGDLQIAIPNHAIPEEVQRFGQGNVIVATVLLSGDVCIYDYEKYAKKMK